MRRIGLALVLAVLLPGIVRAEFVAKDSDFKCLLEGTRPAGNRSDRAYALPRSGVARPEMS